MPSEMRRGMPRSLDNPDRVHDAIMFKKYACATNRAHRRVQVSPPKPRKRRYNSNFGAANSANSVNSQGIRSSNQERWLRTADLGYSEWSEHSRPVHFWKGLLARSNRIKFLGSLVRAHRLVGTVTQNKTQLWRPTVALICLNKIFYRRIGDTSTGGIPRDSAILIARVWTTRRKVHIFRVQPHTTGWRCTRLEVRENQAGVSSAGWVKGELLPLTSEN